MARPIKLSNLVDLAKDKLEEYIKNLEWDLKKLFTQFNSFISFNSVSIGNTEDYCKIDSSGTLTLGGSATAWDDLVMPLTSGKQGALAKPDFDYTNVGYSFPKNDATEILYLIAQMPHKWKLGGRIFPHVHWCQGISSRADYYIDYKWVNLAASTTAVFTTYAMLSTEMAWVSGSTIHQLSTNTAGILNTNITNVSSILLFKLYRNDDVYPGNALTYQFDLHYECDSLGSNTEYSK